MANFDEMLINLHDSTLVDDEINSPIVVTSQRKFEVPQGYNIVIAHEGDVNSQIVTFKLPLKHEGHDLSKCTYKRLKWKNLGNNLEGTSELATQTISSNDFTVAWIVPSEVFSTAGTLEISISIFDLHDNKIAFAWNTPVFSEFSVGKSFSDIGEELIGFYTPAADEVLLIDEETKQIVAPIGYNNIIGNYGDADTSSVYFRIKQKIKGIDLTSETSRIRVTVLMEDNAKTYEIPKENWSSNYTKISNNGDVIDFVWNVSTDITQNSLGYVGTFAIAITIDNENKQWTTLPYQNLYLGDSLLSKTQTGTLTRAQHIIDGSQYVQGNYFSVIPGIVSIRAFDEHYPNDTTINANELVAIYHQNSVEIIIGQEDGQLLSEAYKNGQIGFSIEKTEETVETYLTTREFIIGDI